MSSWEFARQKAKTRNLLDPLLFRVASPAASMEQQQHLAVQSVVLPVRLPSTEEEPSVPHTTQLPSSSALALRSRGLKGGAAAQAKQAVEKAQLIVMELIIGKKLSSDDLSRMEQQLRGVKEQIAISNVPSVASENVAGRNSSQVVLS